jgi:hypothetical protein
MRGIGDVMILLRGRRRSSSERVDSSRVLLIMYYSYYWLGVLLTVCTGLFEISSAKKVFSDTAAEMSYAYQSLDVAGRTSKAASWQDKFSWRPVSELPMRTGSTTITTTSLSHEHSRGHGVQANLMHRWVGAAGTRNLS